MCVFWYGLHLSNLVICRVRTVTHQVAESFTEVCVNTNNALQQNIFPTHTFQNVREPKGDIKVEDDENKANNQFESISKSSSMKRGVIRKDFRNFLTSYLNNMCAAVAQTVL
jgi:uncharacterized protein YpiB (UPF0302 family)